MSKILKNLMFIISILYTISIEPKFGERGQEFKPFVSVPLVKSLKMPEPEVVSFAVQEGIKLKKAVKCLYLDNYDVYDISGLGAKDNGNYKETLTFEDSSTSKTADIWFNFCFNLKKIDNFPAENKQAFIRVDGGNVDILGSDIKNGNQWNIIPETLPNGTITSYIQIIVNNTDNKNVLTYNLKCNGGDKEGKGKFTVISKEISVDSASNAYNVILTVESYEACAKVNFFFIFKFIQDYKVIFIIILIVFGLFNCLFGKRFSKVTSLILTIFTVTVLVLIFSQFVLPSGCAEWIIWVMLAVGLIIGIVLGIIVYKYHEKVIAILAGAISGFFLGQFLYSLFGNQIPANGVLMNVIFVVVSIAILIAVACFLKDTIVIFATSFIGSYCFIRGISLFAGSFPDEFTVIDLVNNEEFEQLKLILTWQVYVYLGAIALTTILSIVIQCIFNKKKDDDEFPKGSKLMKASD